MSSRRVQYSSVSTRSSSKVKEIEEEDEEELGCLKFNPITFSYRPKIDKALVILCFISSMLSLIICLSCFQSYLLRVEHVERNGSVTTYNYGWMRRVDGTHGHVQKSNYLVVLNDQVGLTGFGFGIGHLVFSIFLLYGFCHICIYNPQHPSPYFRCLFAIFIFFDCGLVTTVDVLYPYMLFKNLNLLSERKISPLWGTFVVGVNLILVWICLIFSFCLWCGIDQTRRGSGYEERYDPENYGISKVRSTHRDSSRQSGIKGKFRRFSESFSAISRISVFVPVHRKGSVTHSDSRAVQIEVQSPNSPPVERVNSLSGISDSTSILGYTRKDSFDNQFKKARLDSLASMSHDQLGIPPTICERGRTPASPGECYISDWAPEDVANWVMYMQRLPAFAQNFVDHNIDGRALWAMNDSELIRIGVHDGTARSVILSSVSHMKSQTGPVLPSESATPGGHRLSESKKDDEDEDSDVSDLEESGDDLSPSSKSSGKAQTSNAPVINGDEVVTLDL